MSIKYLLVKDERTFHIGEKRFFVSALLSKRRRKPISFDIGLINSISQKIAFGRKETLLLLKHL